MCKQMLVAVRTRLIFSTTHFQWAKIAIFSEWARNSAQNIFGPLPFFFLILQKLGIQLPKVIMKEA